MQEILKYEVIVVGGGHAGIEASLAASRMGCRTLLITMNLDSIGQMSCNPSIGGVGKGHLVREIDALGGEMAKTTDMTGIQFRMLNTKKGPAVQAPRAQCDKKAYQFLMKSVVERQDNLDIRQASITGMEKLSSGDWKILTNLHLNFHASVVVLTTGTFLMGLMHLGENKLHGGRMGDPSAMDLSKSLISLGIELSRMKTGTPPRLHARSVDWALCECQPGDSPIPYFSNSTDRKFHVEQIPCYLTYTTARTGEIIRANLHRSPMYSGEITGIGPRYCPSIEDKIVRFADKDQHQIYLEPEGKSTDEIYVNGASTSMPYEIQQDIIHSIFGLEKAELLRPAYAVEYDFSPPTQLHPWLESRVVENLFFAGQINGTSGYEEAAAQGIMAGINAALRVKEKDPFLLRRDEAYIGVLIDDLITKGASEPYRMFTSRSEHRLLLRQDNADLRLSAHGHRLGLVSRSELDKVEQKKRKVEDLIQQLEGIYKDGKTLAEIIRRPEFGIRDLDGDFASVDDAIADQVDIVLKYDGYIKREINDVARFASMEKTVIPNSIDYGSVLSLRTEAKQKLGKYRPYTIGQASRIAGVTPSDIAVLSIWIKKAQG
jgi:tRNA uridine 5-carboxymethylaminomethyl modification enzyme